MDISPNAAVSAVLMQQQASVQQGAQITMLKKAMDIQTQGILSLINSLPAAQPGNTALPPNVGQNINTTA